MEHYKFRIHGFFEIEIDTETPIEEAPKANLPSDFVPEVDELIEHTKVEKRRNYDLLNDTSMTLEEKLHAEMPCAMCGRTMTFGSMLFAYDDDKNVMTVCKDCYKKLKKKKREEKSL